MARWKTDVNDEGDVLRVECGGVKPGWDQWFLLMSDAHWDNPHCDRALLKRHFDQAKERKAGILCIGDWYCLMQGRADRRGSKSDLRPEHKQGDYLNAVVNDSVGWLEPYRKNVVMLADGNHETSIKKHLEVDVLDWTCKQLGVPHMGYAGFVQFNFKGDPRGKSKKSTSTTMQAYYHHGSGGGGPVTKGTIQTNRRSSYVDGVDFILSGHIHERWLMETPKVSASSVSMKTRIRSLTHMQLGTYKQEFNLRGGWHVERGAPPKPLGGYWLHFYYDRQAVSTIRVSHEIIATDGGF